MNIDTAASPNSVEPPGDRPEETPLNAAVNGARRLGSVRVDASHLARSYCNVVMANGTRDEVVLHFGVNQDWDRQQPQTSVALHTRVVMNPHAAKRLQARLAQVLTEYETRFGSLQP
jgi:hypothetical protein